MTSGNRFMRGLGFVILLLSLVDSCDSKKIPYSNLLENQSTLRYTEKSEIDFCTDYGHSVAKSLILCDQNSNPNPK